MDSGRGKNQTPPSILFEEKEAEDDELSKSFEIIEIIPPLHPPKTFPKRSRSITTLFFRDKAKRDSETRASFHLVYHEAVKKTMKDEPSASTHHCKINIPDSGLSDTEVTCAANSYLLRGARYVPKMRSYYDYAFDKVRNIWRHRITAVTSRNMPWFKPIALNPLKLKHLIIEGVEKAHQRNLLVKKLEEFKTKLETDPSNKSESHYDTVKNNLNYYTNFFTKHVAPSLTRPIASTTLEDLKIYLHSDTNFDRNTTNNLLNLLEARYEHVKKLDPKSYEAECNIIKKAIEFGKEILKLSLNEKEIDVKDLEEMDQIITAKKIDIDGTEKHPVDEETILTEEVFGRKFQMKVKDLRNYRLVKGHGKAGADCYVSKEGDWHAYNYGDDGSCVDYDMRELDFTHPFKEHDVQLENRNKNGILGDLVTWIKSRKPTGFHYTVRDIENLPNLIDARHEFYFLPAKSTVLSSSTSKNAYRTEDNEVFQQIAAHPVYIFHKFMTMLKYILTTEAMYRSLAELNMRSDLEFPNGDKDAYEGFIQNKVKSMQEFKAVLLQSPAFKDFLLKNGDYVFDLIKKEFTAYKNEHQAKVDKGKDYYKNLVDSIDINGIEKEYKNVFDTVCNNTNVNSNNTAILENTNSNNQNFTGNTMTMVN